jgi:hypothetical protein
MGEHFPGFGLLGWPWKRQIGGFSLSDPAEIMAPGRFWAVSGCRYAAAASSFGIRIRL